MPYSPNGLNAMLSGIAAEADYVSLHTAEPDGSGSDEVTGGTYARRAITWNTPSAGSTTSASQPVLDVPGGTTITHVGLWSAATSGTYFGSLALDEPETYGSSGSYTISTATMSIANA